MKAPTKQSAFTIVTDVKRDEVGDLADLLNQIGDDINKNPHLRFGELDDLHYASFCVVEDGGAGPYLVFEGNVDGSSRGFLEQLVGRAGPAMDEIYGHCVGYPGAGSADGRAVVGYLKAHDIGTDTFYVAWPGRSVGEICREHQLRERIEEFVDQHGPDLRQQRPHTIRRRIQEHVDADASLGWARTVPPTPFLVRHGKKVLGLVVAVPVLALVKLLWRSFSPSSSRSTRGRSRLVLLGTGAVAACAAVKLRVEERRDERDDGRRDPDWETAYARWSDNLAGIVQRENVQGQNHLASVVRIKDGRFRLATLRLVLWAINLLARLTANRGSLGGIASIHFARWVITPDRKHLIFLSNFDGSWESYLNDFIDLAAGGLTAVWTNTDNRVGFPVTRWLVGQGARDEQRFKAYARYSQVRTNAWYSAYPDLSVTNIENNMRVREELFGPLDEKGTEAWLRRL